MKKPDPRPARPADFVYAWNAVTGSAEWAKTELRAHPVPSDVIDPIYHRDRTPNGGWSLARDIRNAAAISIMRRYFTERAIILPEEIDTAWDLSLERMDARTQIISRVNQALENAWESGARTPADFAQHVTAALATQEA